MSAGSSRNKSRIEIQLSVTADDSRTVQYLETDNRNWFTSTPAPAMKHSVVDGLIVVPTTWRENSREEEQLVSEAKVVG